MAQTLYLVSYLGSATDPADDATGHAQIKNGQDGSGASAAFAGSTAWAGPSTYIDPTGLSQATTYATAAVVYDDVLLQYSNRVLATETRTLLDVTFTVSGGITFAGTVALLRNRTQIPSGSFNLSGSVTPIKERSFVPAGEVVFSGTAPFQTSAEFVISPSGTVEFAGTVEANRVRALVPAGNIVFSGSNVILREKNLSPAGSIDFSGTNTLLRTKVLAPTGQVTFQGHAAIIFRPFDAIDGQYINRLTIGVSRANRLS